MRYRHRRSNRNDFKLDKCLHKSALIADIMTSTCFFGFFCAQLADKSLWVPSSSGFTEGWRYIGYVTAAIFLFSFVINIILAVMFKSSGSTIPNSTLAQRPVWTFAVKGFALFALMAAGAFLNASWEKQFPLLFAIGLTFLMVSKFFPKKNMNSQKCCASYCHYEFFLSFLFLPQIFSVISVYISINGFISLSRDFLLGASVVGLVFSAILVACIAFKNPYYITQSQTINPTTSRRELSDIKEETSSQSAAFDNQNDDTTPLTQQTMLVQK